MKNVNLTEKQWKLIEKYMTGVPGKGGTHGKNNRLFIEAVIYMGVTHTSWKKVPEYFGDGHAIYTRYRRWHVKGIWKKIIENCAEDTKLKNLLEDVLPLRRAEHKFGVIK